MRKGIPPALLLLFPCLWGAFAQSAQNSLAASIAELPSCALDCLVSAVEKSTCSVTNTTCVCNTAPLQAQVTLCVSANCTVIQGLKTKNITENLCGAPIRDKGNQINVLATTFGALSGLAVALRVASKLVTGLDMGWDDYSIIALFVIGLPSTVMEVAQLTPNGLGRDIWTLTPLQITNFLRFFYALEILYFAQVPLLKLSLLCFYLRIFPSPGFRVILWATLLLDVAFGIAFVMGGVFQCQPISYYWTQWDAEHKGSCVDINGMAWANAIISIILDIWLLGLAISQLMKLQMHWKKKVGVGLMFAVATFVTLVSILRLRSLLEFANSSNVTWGNFSVIAWSTVEINVGIICACMPSMRILLVRLFPKLFGSTNRSTNKDPARSSNRLGTNVSVRVTKSKTATRPIDKKSIVYSQSYDVDLEDETCLVPMKDVYIMPESGSGSSRHHGKSFFEDK